MNTKTSARYDQLTEEQLTTAVHWMTFYRDRARWAGYSRVAGRAAAALRDLRAELFAREACRRYCNHVAAGLREPESEFICRRYAGHSGSHSEDHNVTRMARIS